MGKDSAARIKLGRSFHQMGTVNEKVCESDFVYVIIVVILYMLYVHQQYFLHVHSSMSVDVLPC